MLNEYFVRFIKGNQIFERYIQANDEKQAIELAEFQAKFTIKGGGFKFLSIRKNGEEDTYLKDLDKYVSGGIIERE